MIFVSFTILLLGLAVSAANVPSCNWISTQYHGIQATDICIAGGWAGQYDSMYKCEGGVVKYNVYTLNAGCTGAVISEIATFDTLFDCSQSTCTDYAIYPWYGDDQDCTSYTHEILLPNICLDIDPSGAHSYVRYQVYDDSSRDPNFNVQVINYNDAECTDIDRCFTFSDVPSENAACGEPPILSYTGTAATEKESCGGGGGSSCSQNQTPSCNWVLSKHFGVQAIDVCVEGGNAGQDDSMYTCAIDPNTNNQIVVLNLYTLSSGCIGTGNAIDVVTDPSQFDCSQSTCTDYVIWPWYFDADDCTSYSVQATIPNMCLCNGDSFQIGQVYDDASQNPSFDMEIFDYGNDGTCTNLDKCYTMSNGPPSNNAACGAEFVTFYSGTPNTEKTSCGGSNGGDPDLDGEYDINIDIDCNWVYDSEWIRVVGICDTMKPDPDNLDIEIDSQIVCNGITSVSRKYYDSSDGSCSGDVVHTSDMTSNPTLFDCSMNTCGQNNYIKFRRYSSCNTSFTGFSTYNMVINQCFHDIEDNTDYFVTCDSANEGFRYGYDTGDYKCGALTVDMTHYTDLNTECEMLGDEEASYEVMSCYGSESPTDVPTNNPSGVPTNNPSGVPTNNPSAPSVVATDVTPAAGANRISEYILSIIMVVVIFALIN